MEGINLESFNLPDGAHDALKKLNMGTKQLADGVNYFTSGHDRGVAYRFYVHQVKNEKKSLERKIPKYDSIEMIEWHKDKFEKPVERVRLLPEELLAFDPLDPEVCVGGRFKESYERFKAGLDAPGLSLGKWGVLSDSDVATLADLKIYSVEQLAAQPRSKIVGKFPKELEDAFELAIQFVQGKDGRVQAAQNEEKLFELSQENAKLKAEMAEIKAMLTSANERPAKKKKETENVD